MEGREGDLAVLDILLGIVNKVDATRREAGECRAGGREGRKGEAALL